MSDAAICAQALGQDATHLIADDQRPSSIACPVHAGIVEPLLALQGDAARAGFDLQVVSGWRGFERQAAIWDAKLRGERAVLDDNECPVDMGACSPIEQVHAVLRWSALPGASRHHWGTDIDIIDAAAVSTGYRAQLTQAEAREQFGALHAWLDERIANNRAYGFYRPYDCDRGGVGPEPWHLSYKPLAAAYAQLLSESVLRSCWEAHDLCAKAAVLQHLPGLFERFVKAP